jgi:hypothetical protein
MKFGQKFVSVVGTLALGIGLTAGVAFANDGNAQSQMDLSLNVTCQRVADVRVSGNGSFAPIDIAGGSYSTSTADDAIKVAVDVGCYWGGWRVDAEVSRFRSIDTNDSFSGGRLSLEAGEVTSVFDGSFPGSPFTEPIAPHAHDADFQGSNDEELIFHTTNLFNLIGADPALFENPAPYQSTARYTGHLDNLNDVKPGEYIATLTTVLTLED